MMKRLLAFTLVLLSVVLAAASDYVPRDLVWTTQSANSSGSMPCGGHDIGLNVWVEQGDVLFYAQQSGWVDENNTLLKAGRWRLHVAGNPLNGTHFEQRLCLDDGAVYISGGGLQVCIWADVQQPVVYVNIVSKLARSATLSYESWRWRDRPLTKAECQQCSYKWVLPANCTTFADSIAALQHSLTFAHTNRDTTVFDFTVEREHLNAVKDSLDNPIGGRSMGGTMSAPGFRFAGTATGTYASTDYKSWNFVARRLKNTTVSIALYNSEKCVTAVADCPPDASASQLARQAAASRQRSAAWWHAFWQRSWIVTDNVEAHPMVRNYELMRYLLGCNAKGQWPTKFNGGLFTFDPVYVDSAMAFTPDYRKWGGGTMTA